MSLLQTLLISVIAGAVLPTEQITRNERAIFSTVTDTRPVLDYIALEKDDCLARLTKRGIEQLEAPPVPSIDAPLRLPKLLRGVRFEHWSAPMRSAKVPRPVLDCRLLLSLDDMAKVALRHDVAAIRYNSLYRGRYARNPGQRHAAGVAIDINAIVTTDDHELVIKRDFAGHGVGSRTCGLGAPWPLDTRAATLRQFVCGLDAAGSFNLILTPHYDRGHQDHLHLEVRRGIRWRITQ